LGNCSRKRLPTTKLKTIADDRDAEALNGSEGYRDDLEIVNRHLLILWSEINSIS
jgi:hypothetical protein